MQKDIYGKKKDIGSETLRILDQLGVSEKVGWEKVETMLQEKSGIAVDFTL